MRQGCPCRQPPAPATPMVRAATLPGPRLRIISALGPVHNPDLEISLLTCPSQAYQNTELLWSPRDYKPSSPPRSGVDHRTRARRLVLASSYPGSPRCLRETKENNRNYPNRPRPGGLIIGSGNDSDATWSTKADASYTTSRNPTRGHDVSGLMS